MEIRGVAPLLQVYDMPASVRFYRDLLGFVVVNTSPLLGEGRFHWALLRLGEAEIMLNTAYETEEERPAREDRARVLGHGDVTLYFRCPDVEAAYTELLAKGVRAVKAPEVTWYGMKQMTLVDPDGYGVCFQWSADGD